LSEKNRVSGIFDSYYNHRCDSPSEESYSNISGKRATGFQPVNLGLEAQDTLSGCLQGLVVTGDQCFGWQCQLQHWGKLDVFLVDLREQFGQEYQGKDADKDFKKKFLIALRAVLAVYPQANVKQVTGGLMLKASPPPIPYKGQ